MDADARRAALERLEPLVGEWRLELGFAGAPEAGAVVSRFEWALDRQYVIQRTSIPSPPEAPDSMGIYDVAGDGFVQHYFDSRGVTRLYAMTFGDGAWTMSRESPDFTELPFAQRWRAEVGPDLIEGTWEIRHEGAGWEKDFDLVYRRVG